jgi:ATP-binding cassette, subfamily B, bacterial
VPPRAPSLAALLRRFAPDVRPLRAALAALVLVSVATPVVDTAAVWIFKRVIDEVLVPRAPAAFPPLALLLVALTAADGALGFAERVLSTWTAERFLLALRGRAIGHLLRARGEVLDRLRLGDLLSRLTADAAAVESFLVSGLGLAVADALRVLFFTGALFLLSWRLAAVALAAAPLLAWATRRVSRRLREASRETRRRAGAAAAVAEESLASAAIVQAFGREAFEEARYVAEARRAMRSHLAAARLRGLLSPLLDAGELAAGLAVVGLGAVELSRGRISLGGLLVFVTYVGKLYGPARAVGGFVATAHAAAAGAERLAELFDLAVVREAPGARALPAPRGRVTFEGVTYRYPGAAEDALSAVSFEVAPGELLAVVGPNGAGKSTLARLLLRLVEPGAGRILLDGVDVRELTLASLRSAIALVPQDASLFHATVRENIAYGRDGASPAEVERAAWAAHAHAFVRRLPDGYDTSVGERGRALSGGQRQRIVLARALVRRAPVLLLDEPTTGLDAAAGRRVVSAVRRHADGRTRIVISHDLRAVRDADQVLVLDRGRVVERGTPAQLLARGGAYAALCRAPLAPGAAQGDGVGP